MFDAFLSSERGEGMVKKLPEALLKTCGIIKRITGRANSARLEK
jgi:hypothetical protein